MSGEDCKVAAQNRTHKTLNRRTRRVKSKEHFGVGKKGLKDCDGPVTIRRNVDQVVTDLSQSLTQFKIVTDLSVTILKFSVTKFVDMTMSDIPSQFSVFRHNYRHNL